MKVKRNTKQKEIILKVVRSSCIHPTAEEVFKEVNKIDSKVSVSTVYRNLQEMTEDKVIEKIIDNNGINRFDGKCCNHYHLICNKCNRIIDLDIPYDISINNLVKDSKIDCHSITFKGICSDCLNHFEIKKEK